MADDDSQLLRAYVEERSQGAFAELVNRYLPLVYRSALRQLSYDRHRAEDVTQVVFIALAQKAAALSRHTHLTRWLYTTTRHTVCRTLRGENRRRRREQEISTMPTPPQDSTPEADWQQLGPVLDEALRSLGSLDRDAILLRYFSNRSFAQVGAALEMREDAARMRVARALEKLRTRLSRQGVATTAAGLLAMFAEETALGAPASLTKTILVAAQAAPATVAVTTTLFSIMTTSKIVAGSAILLAVVVAGSVTMQSRHDINALKAELARIDREKRDAMDTASKQTDEIGSLKKMLSDAQYSLVAATPSPADRPFENALELWIGKVAKLSAYLVQHPNLRIPQMDGLNPENWLDVTKDLNLACEADYRKALGTLRGKARNNISKELGKALKLAFEANQGKPLSDPQALAPYLPAGFNPAILQQLAINPSGKIPGLVSSGMFVLVDKPVDLWDATIFYSKEGDVGLMSSWATGEDKIKNAIAEYTKATGQAPSEASKLKDYDGIAKINPADLDTIFQALVTKPNIKE